MLCSKYVSTVILQCQLVVTVLDLHGTCSVYVLIKSCVAPIAPVPVSPRQCFWRAKAVHCSSAKVLLSQAKFTNRQDVSHSLLLDGTIIWANRKYQQERFEYEVPERLGPSCRSANHTRYCPHSKPRADLTYGPGGCLSVCITATSWIDCT